MKKKLVLFLPGLIFILVSCRKDQFDGKPSREQATASYSSNDEEGPFCYDCEQLAAFDHDTLAHATILGGEIQNPYTLTNIAEAYHNIFGRYPGNVPVTHLYVKFLPSDFEQLAGLVYHTDEREVELFDFPLDREVLLEGDYYLPPGYSATDVTPYYAVVPTGFDFPGIPYEVLEEMFIPDDAPALEDEALYLTGNLAEEPTVYLTRKEQRIQYYQRYPPPCDLTGPHWNPDGCEPISGGGAGEYCGTYPKGKILVQNNLGTQTGFRAVRQARVVIRRFLKISRVYTDDMGVFKSKKYFPNKYSILTKFKNQYAVVSRMGFYRSEMFFPIKKYLGTYKNLECGHEFRIPNPGEYGTIATSQWAGAVAHNAVIEQREMCQQEEVGTPPLGLHVMLSRDKPARNGNTYMFHKIMQSLGGANQILGDIADAAAIWEPVSFPPTLVLEAWKAAAPDVLYGIGADPALPAHDFLKTDQYCELLYHELSHASHYSATGFWFWVDLGKAEFKNPGLGGGSYGPCCTQYSPLIALAEGWAYHMGHYLADKKWGLQSTTFPEQGDFRTGAGLLFFSNSSSLSSHINFLEQFNPNKGSDPNRWIPKGLLNDLMDGGIEPSFASTIGPDNVSGYTNGQFFQALMQDIKNLQQFKDRLLQQNAFWQQSGVNELFFQYNY